MQISITNGTLTSISETLSPSSGYTLPNSISVNGATSVYNSSTGLVELSNLTSTISIEASGEQASIEINKTKIGAKSIIKKVIGTKEVIKEVVNGITVYEVVHDYSYSQIGDELTINNAPYTQNGEELTIGE